MIAGYGKKRQIFAMVIIADDIPGPQVSRHEQQLCPVYPVLQAVFVLSAFLFPSLLARALTEKLGA